MLNFQYFKQFKKSCVFTESHFAFNNLKLSSLIAKLNIISFDHTPKRKNIFISNFLVYLDYLSDVLLYS